MEKEKQSLREKARALMDKALAVFRKKPPASGAADAADSSTEPIVPEGEGAGTKTFKRASRSSATTRQVPRLSQESLTKGTDALAGVLFVPRMKPRSFLFSTLFTSLWLCFLLVFVLGAAGLGAVVGVARAYMETTPELDLDRLDTSSLAQTSYIYDGKGNLITSYIGSENREWVPIADVPDMLKNAFMAIEDVRFLKHEGIDYKRLFGVAVKQLMNDDDGGGSTITQQLIKNRILSNEISYKRKLQEAYLALELEKIYTKDQILEAYLNMIHLGESNYGIKAAAEDYFGKSLNQLTVRECAMLAGLTQNPYTYNPRKNMYQRDRFELTNKRTDVVLDRMYEAGFINREQYNGAKNEDVRVNEFPNVKNDDAMRYFVEYAIDDVISCMLIKENRADTTQNRSEIRTRLRTGGYKIYTTVDPDMQRVVEDTLYNWEEYPAMKYPADNVTRSDVGGGEVIEFSQPQAAAVVVDYRTGQLKAIVGGKQPPEVERGLNRAVQGQPPIGSSIKPLTVYGPALDAGAGAGTIEYNMPGAIEGYGLGANELGYPENYGGERNPGPVTIRSGIRSSLNIVAARTLYRWVTPPIGKDYLIKMGVDPGRINADGPGLALGTSGLRPIEVSSAFGAIANGGVWIQPRAFSRVEDSRGNIVLDATDPAVTTTRQIYKKTTSWMLTDMLTEAVESGTGTNAKISGMTVAGKTGTNDDSRGVYFAGYTPYYAAAVLVAHDNYKPLRTGATGGSYAAPLWQAFMSELHEGLANRPIISETPEELGLVQATVCAISGKLATPECANDVRGYKPVTDWFAMGTEPTEPCDMHVSQTVCSISGKLATSYCPPETVTQQGILVIPPEHALRTVDPETLASVFPHAFLDMPDAAALERLVPGTPEYEMYYCPVHTQFWYEQQQQQLIFQQPGQPGVYYPTGEPAAGVTLSDEYTALIARAQAFLSDPNTVLDDYARNRLQTLMAELQRAITLNDQYEISVRYVELRNALESYGAA